MNRLCTICGNTYNTSMKEVCNKCYLTIRREEKQIQKAIDHKLQEARKRANDRNIRRKKLDKYQKCVLCNSDRIIRNKSRGLCYPCYKTFRQQILGKTCAKCQSTSIFWDNLCRTCYTEHKLFIEWQNEYQPISTKAQQQDKIKKQYYHDNRNDIIRYSVQYKANRKKRR